MGTNTRNPGHQTVSMDLAPRPKVAPYTPVLRRCATCGGKSSIEGSPPCEACLSNGFVEVRKKGTLTRVQRRLEDKRRKKAGVTIVVVEE